MKVTPSTSPRCSNRRATPAKRASAARAGVERGAQLQPGHQGGGGVAGVVGPGDGQVHLAQDPAVVLDGERRAGPAALQVDHAVVGALGGAVGEGPGRGAELGGQRIVDAHHPGARRLGQEPDEGRLQRLEPAVELEVVGLDVGHDGGVAGQLEERAVALVGLDHQQVALVPDRPGADLVDVAADDERRPQPGLDQHEGQHRRGRGLAVGAGHRHAAAGGGDGGQGLGPAQHGDLPLLGGHDLGVAGRDGGRDGDRVEVGRQVGRVVAHGHRDAQGPQPLEAGRLLEVAARHLVAHGGEHGGDGAHAGPADADHVHLGRPGQVQQLGSSSNGSG